MSSSLIPKNPNFPITVLAAAGAMPSSVQINLLSVAGTYTLPALSTVEDGTCVWAKYTGASSSATVNPSGSDTIDGGSTSSISLTSAGAGQGLGCQLVVSKTLATWIRLVKPQ